MYRVPSARATALWGGLLPTNADVPALIFYRQRRLMDGFRARQ